MPLNDPESVPLIFAGGPTATSNPEPYSPFFDFIALGDGEELLPEIGLVVAEAKANGWRRSQLLRDLAQVPGVYVPSLYGLAADGVSLEPLFSELPQRVIRRVATPMPHYAMALFPTLKRCMTVSRSKFDGAAPVAVGFASPECSLAPQGMWSLKP